MACKELKESATTPETVNVKWTAEEFNKKAVAITIPVDRLKPVVQKIKALNYYENQKPWIAELMKSSKLQEGSAPIAVAGALGQIKKLLTSALPDPLLPPRGLNNAGGVEKAFAIQLFQKTDGCTTVRESPYCLPECRIIYEGSELLLGYPFHEIEGDTIAKTTKIRNLSAEQAIQLAKSVGFIKNLQREWHLDPRRPYYH